MAVTFRHIFYLQKIIRSRIFQQHRLPILHVVRKYSDPANEDTPLKYSTSEAATWKAVQARGGEEIDDKPWYQNIVISVSVGTFLLYFCVLREESDIDIELGKSLYDRVPGLEEKQLQVALKYYKDHGIDTTQIEQRIMQLEAQNK